MFHVLRTAQPMVSGYEMELYRVRRIATEQKIHKFTAAFRSNHRVAGPMQDRRPHPSHSIKARGPVGLAFFHPFPRQRPIPVERIIIPRHPAGAMPIMSSFGRDGLRAYAHHIEGRGDEDQSFHLILFLGHQPGDPASQRIADDREPGNGRVTGRRSLAWQARGGRV